jgi:hypothetical protein
MFEEDMMHLDSVRAELNRLLVAKKIDGLRYNTLRNQCDDVERKCKGKLLRTRLDLQDFEHARKTSIVVQARDDGKIYRRSQGKWQETSEGELVKLVQSTKQGLTEVPYRGRRTMVGGSNEEPGRLLKWKQTSRAEGREALARGANVRFGEGDSAEVLE